MNVSLILNQPDILNVFSLKGKFNLKLFSIISVLIIGALLAFYVFQVSSDASERYLIQEYNIKINEIARQNQSLEINLVRANSLENMLSLMADLNLEKAENIHYIKVMSNQVVQNRVYEKLAD